MWEWFERHWLSLAHNAIPLPAAITIQTVDPALLLILPWAASRKWPSSKPAVAAGASAWAGRET